MITNDKFLTYAKRIVSNSSIPEEEARSAISRAYYSLYHETLTVALNKYSLNLIYNIEKDKKKHLTQSERYQLNALDSTFLRNCNFHRILPKTFLDLGLQILAIRFKDFRDKRNQADYDLKLTFHHSDAATIVNSIDSLVHQVKSL